MQEPVTKIILTGFLKILEVSYFHSLLERVLLHYSLNINMF